MKLPRYTQARVNADGETVYRFNPPNKLIDKGITKRVSLGTDRNIALMQIGVLNDAIDEYYNNERLSNNCLLYTSPSPRDATLSRMPSSA